MVLRKDSEKAKTRAKSVQTFNIACVCAATGVSDNSRSSGLCQINALSHEMETAN